MLGCDTFNRRMPNLVIVSNRLPVSIKKTGTSIEVYPSSGGLATGLSSYTKRRGTKWIGWPGLPSDDLSEADKIKVAKQLKKYRCYPVFLTKKQIDEFYNGYSNSVLWPLFHELPIHTGDNQANWDAYRSVNQQFATTTLQLSEPGSTIWVHDYQLLLTPQMLRAERPNDQVGFFLHIPFPKQEVFTPSKHAAKLLAGMLGADLVGFHTSVYTQNFLDGCTELNFGSQNGRQILLQNRTVLATDFPMGIDYGKFARASKQRKVRSEYKRLQRKYAGKKVIATVDRLDPTKGFVERLEAYQELLGTNTHLHGGIVMVMLAIPSRGDIIEYQKLKQRVEELIAAINTEFGNQSWQPIEYMYQTLPFEELSALYQRADIAFVAPVRDGMNLVAKEYLASQPDQKGILVLSETAGAAQELKDAIQVNPAQPKTLVRGLSRALALPTIELQRRTGTMQRHLSKFTVQNWADTFIDSLQKPRTIHKIRVQNMTGKVENELLSAYSHAQSRLLLLDYDGVLRSFTRDPAEAKPTPDVLETLRRLGADTKNDVMVVSGRSRTDLSNWFGDLPIALAAEHGALIRRKGGKNWHKTSGSGLDWQHQILDILEYYAEQTPGASVEQKEWALVWHYRTASPYYTQKHLVTLRRLLKPIVKKHSLEILEGNKILEVRPKDISKRRAAQEWLVHDHDFVLALGDDVTDEDMFTAMPPQAYSIKVGRGQTAARFRLKSVTEVVRLLSKL
jgi:trehalose 6-phosphate synthase/phosphatase